METGGRQDHVRRTRSLSRRALCGDRESGWLYRLCACCSHPQHARRQQPRSARGCGRVSGRRHLDHAFRRHAGRAAAAGHGLSRSSHHHLVPDLRAGGRHLLVLCLDRRAIPEASGLVGRFARRRHRQHALCRHSRPRRSFRYRPRPDHGAALGRGRDRHRLWRPARLPGAAGGRPADRQLGCVRRRRLRHALHGDARHAFRAADRCGASPCRRRSCRVAANPVDHRCGAVLRHRSRLPAVAGSRPAASRRRPLLPPNRLLRRSRWPPSN